MRNPFKRVESEAQPAHEPAPVAAPKPTPTRAVSNLDPYGLPPEVSGLRGQEASFPTKEAAIEWLRSHGGGGISWHNGRDFQSERVPPG
jgi:hypothetical protein